MCSLTSDVCHEIVDLYVFSRFEPIWAPDIQAKVFLHSFLFCRDIRNAAVCITPWSQSPRCASHRGVKQHTAESE